MIVLVAWRAAAEGRPSYEQIVRQFEAISFSSEYQGDARRGFLSRWESVPVRLTIEGGDWGHRSTVAAVFAELQDLSGIAMTVVAASERPNAFLRFQPSGECRMSLRNGFAYLTIAADRVTRCLWAELSQMIGPTNDACHYRPSLFCDGEANQTPTWADRIIMRATFDPRLRDMMPKAEAMPLARQIIRELYDAGG